jgi:hypothetical protein
MSFFSSSCYINKGREISLLRLDKVQLHDVHPRTDNVCGDLAPFPHQEIFIGVPQL